MAEPALTRPPRGRWAPTPSGALHVGSARTALAAWLAARSQGGSFVWRVEDLDPPRVVPGAAAAALADLGWLGLDWDEGPDRGGPHGPYEQSERGEFYRAALARLAAAGHLFPCRRSRKDLENLATAPHGPEDPEGHPPYPAAWRPATLPADWFTTHQARRVPDAALRFRVPAREVVFVDRVFGEVRERVDEVVGDFVLQRRDGLFAYQLAVVVDDLRMGITQVVRGADLLASTARQVLLLEALGGTPPEYAHLPLVVNSAGEKLSKRDGAVTLAEIRAAGGSAAELTGVLAFSLGQLDRPEPCRPRGLVAGFDWARVPREPWRYSPSP